MMIALARFAIGRDDGFIVRLFLDSRLFQIKLMINFSYSSFFAAKIFMSAWSVPKFQDVIAYFTFFRRANGIFPTINVSQNQLLIFSQGF